jgi:hypothetical protein
MVGNCTAFVNAAGLKQYDGMCSMFGNEGTILPTWLGEPGHGCCRATMRWRAAVGAVGVPQLAMPRRAS